MFQIREESSATRLWFVTTGYLVRLLAHNMESFKKFTHLVIDEVHERSADGDILCLLAKKVHHFLSFSLLHFLSSFLFLSFLTSSLVLLSEARNRLKLDNTFPLHCKSSPSLSSTLFSFPQHILSPLPTHPHCLSFFLYSFLLIHLYCRCWRCTLTSV